MKDSLLDYLTELTDCGYISNLRAVALNEEQKEKLLTVPDNLFPLDEYERSLSYILGKIVTLQTIGEGKQQLVTALSRVF